MPIRASSWPPKWFMPACLLWVVAGCGGGDSGPALDVHPVKGRLLTKAGQPAAGGAVEFVRMGDPPHSARSEVATDGSFSLFSMTADGRKFDGAEEGEFRVIYSPATNDQTVAPIELPTRVKVQPGPNDLQLTLPK